MRKTLIVALAVAGLASTLAAPPVMASAMNGMNLGNGLIVRNGVDINGTDLGGLSLEGVILPETAG